MAKQGVRYLPPSLYEFVSETSPVHFFGGAVYVCSFGEFENGKIKGRRDYWDSVTLREQLLGKLDKN